MAGRTDENTFEKQSGKLGVQMKIGKISESVLKRSILKQVNVRREEVLLGAGVGEDCAAMQLKPDEVFTFSTDPITGTTKDIGGLAIHITANDLATSGAQPVAVLLSVLLPPSVDEEEIRTVMSQVERACQELNIQVIGGHTEVTAAVNQIVLTVTGIGKVKRDHLIATGGARPGQDLVVTKWVGVEGTSIIAKECEQMLKCRFPEEFVETAKGFDQYLSVVPEAEIAAACGASAMHDVTEGGIFGALWELGEASDLGLEVDLKKLPIRQETVEICNYLDLNPYALISSGSLLIATDHGSQLVSELDKAGISAAVVGHTTDGNCRVVRNEEDTRYLEPPKTDELYKIYDREGNEDK